MVNLINPWETRGALVNDTPTNSDEPSNQAPLDKPVTGPHSPESVLACLSDQNLSSFVLVNLSETTDTQDPAEQVQPPTYTVVGTQTTSTFIFPLSSSSAFRGYWANLTCPNGQTYTARSTIKSCMDEAGINGVTTPLVLAIFQFGLLNVSIQGCTISFWFVDSAGQTTTYTIRNLDITVTGNGADASSVLAKPYPNGGSNQSGGHLAESASASGRFCSLSPDSTAHHAQGTTGGLLGLLLLASILRFQQRKQLQIQLKDPRGL
jgi:hypothetical protein